MVRKHIDRLADAIAYRRLQPFVDRLVREWTKHKSIIIALDFDDTVRPYGDQPASAHARCVAVVNLVKECQVTGAWVTVWTAAERERWPSMVDYLEQRGLRVDAVNENQKDIPFGKHGKIYANIYLDDRGGLTQAMRILRLAHTRVKHR